MKSNLVILCFLLVLSACKFSSVSKKTLLTNDDCFEWKLIGCNSNIENLNSADKDLSILFCEDGTGIIINDGERNSIRWNLSLDNVIEDKTQNDSLCWTNNGYNYCYQIQLLNANKLVLTKDNSKTDGYEKRVVCTYKPRVN